ncbi:hypothetical protein SAMN05660420_01222 [Desulfuromusa kysingii]|uniref:Fission protein ELM1 n=1 Tax=Desulfuromusa kysingii TaxID=37625 RepID=A0A1H3YFS0_9BACT|nr:ELM1/GtrOC1 family putative glycosyltransferase [Desulfuromusa kysingii]SEA10415.1 hypothetical protein SAMN05660420_01222 [Desulfuromusa kysingii]
MKGKRFLILSDGKPGHVSQSIAFAKHLGSEYEVNAVRFKKPVIKAFSYLFGRLGIYSPYLFETEKVEGVYSAVVSAGSGTYYANKTLAKQLGCKSVAIMLPRGYRLDFDLIVAQQHDNLPAGDNIISIPINVTYVEPQRVVVPRAGEKYIALIVGGDSQHGQLDVSLLQEQVKKIFSLFPKHKVWMTTSPRTPKAIEVMLQSFNYERAVYFSQEPINPIPDYLQHSDYVFLTADSSSMISEAVSFGKSCVEVLPLSESIRHQDKFAKLITLLSEMNCLHLFDGSCGTGKEKISLVDLFKQQINETF